jgi:hypothetical protein
VAGAAIFISRRRRSAGTIPNSKGWTDDNYASTDPKGGGPNPSAWMMSSQDPTAPPASASFYAGLGAAGAGNFNNANTTEPSPFLQSLSTAPALARDPVLSWVATGLRRTGPSRPAKKKGSRLTGHRLIDIKEVAVERPIGAGSFGRVFVGTWRETPVAIKILVDANALPEEGAASAEQARLAAALDQEAGLMSQLHHPNIVLFLGVCEFPPAIVTEWCPRGSLYDVLVKGRIEGGRELPWPRRLRMALDAAKGMLHLHGHQPAPIVHRDLKGANLLVDEHWNVKVADFNLSRLAQEQRRVGSAVSSSGGGPMNPRWLAPEIMGGAPFTTASDAFAFGVVMWELLCWDVPWMGMTDWQIVGAVRDSGGRPPVPPVGKLPGGGFPGLQAYLNLMRRCWEQLPGNRPGFDVIAAELNRLVRQYG